MPLLDPNLRQRAMRYVAQCLAATATICLILLGTSIVFRAGIVATLGATTFIVFAMPHSKPAQTRRLIGGYLVGSGCGVLGSLILRQLALLMPNAAHSVSIVVGSLAVGLAIFVMVLAQTEHPPAAGMSLMLVLSPWTWSMILLVLSSVISMSLVRWLFRNRLINLV